MTEINILGAVYTIEIVSYEEDKIFEQNSSLGYCEVLRRRIVICDSNTDPELKDSPEEVRKLSMRRCIRHEIVHAFFLESGLSSNSLVCASAWAENEEMVDWIALQGPKIYEAWRVADALE